MKQLLMVMAVALAGCVLWNGCGRTEEPAPAARPPQGAMEPTPTIPEQTTPAPTPPAVVEPTPPSATELMANATNGVEEALAMARDGKYQEALTLLQQKATEVQGNPDAMKLINDATAQVKQMMAAAATKGVTDKAQDAVGGLGESLGR